MSLIETLLHASQRLKGLRKIFLSVLLGVVGQLAMKHGMAQGDMITGMGWDLLFKLLDPWVFSGLAAYGLAMVIWLAVLAEADLSFAYPMLSLGYVFIALFSWLLFHEHVSPIRWLGIIIICFGVYLVSGSSSEPSPSVNPEKPVNGDRTSSNKVP